MSGRHMLALVAAAAMLLAACSDVEPPAVPTTAPVPTPAPAGASGEDTWLVMLYANADDPILERDIFTDINEAERIGSDERLTIVTQFDRYEGAFEGDGDWTSTKRFRLTRDDDLEAIGSEELEDLGELNMADGQTLADFVIWAVERFPATHHVLILSDHGMGWPGGWNDPAPGGPGPDGLALTADGDLLLTNEIAEALGFSLEQTGLEKFAMVGFDACLMGHIEVLSELAPYADYVVASQETEPALGWAYTSFLQQFISDGSPAPDELGEAIVDTYIEQDQRIVDDAARAAFVEENFGFEGDTTPEEVAQEMSVDITLSAYRTAAVPDLLAALDLFVAALSNIDQDIVAEARTYVQSFTDVFGSDAPSSYIDLGHFAEILREESGSDEVAAAADTLIAAIQQTLIAERNGPDRPGASGLSIYFPDSNLYETEVGGYESYAAIVDSFAAGSTWENFLNFHYYGMALEEDGDPRGQTLTAPGASELTLSELRLSEERINQADTTIVSTQVSGEHIGFIYSFTGYYNPEEDTILIADMDFIDAGQSRDVSGVFYPDWGDSGLVEIEYEWSPLVYGVNDGQTTEFALLMPEDYGDTDESATYVVDGMYTFVKDGTRRYAQLFFKDGELVEVLGFSGEDAVGAPREITPAAGDTFTMLDQYIALNSDDPDAAVEYFSEEGGVLIFSDTPFTVEELIAPAGDYVLGSIAEDLDGNSYEVYTTVTVDE